MNKKIIIMVLLLFLSGFGQQTVFSQNRIVQCGDTLEGTFTQNEEVHQYTIDMRSGEILKPESIAFGEFLEMVLAVRSPSGDILINSVGNQQSPSNRVSWGEGDQNPTVDTGILSASGEYLIEIASANNNGVGDYTLRISCTDRVGNIIDPDNPLVPTDPTASPTDTTDFSGFGFAGLPSVDFSAGVEQSISLGESETATIASDLVAIYIYEAHETQAATLAISRESGDISIGVAVIKWDTNELIFMGGMPSSDNLSVGLTFPSAGIYAIGLFVLDTPERNDTSGAVEIRLE